MLKINGLETDFNLKVEGVIPLADGDSIRHGDKKFVYVILGRQNCNDPYPTAKIE